MARKTTALARGNTRGAVADMTKHRLRAIYDQVLDAAEKRDLVGTLTNDLFTLPPMQRVTWLADFAKLAGIDLEAQPGGGGLGSQAAAAFAGIFAGAAAQAASQRLNASSPDAIDVEVTRVHDGCSDAQPLDEQW